jgi:hypothetical protein
MDSDSEVSEATSEATEDCALLWSETESLLLRIVTLQDEATQRTEALMTRISSDWILSCHMASLEDVHMTGEVSFGKRLLASLRS